ncbi:MAG: EamA family transporter [Bacteroidota bacterium]|nr:EamA family transporter [Bacteroidota bacterium]
MLYLLGSIFLTSYLTLAFKVVEKYKISNLQTIVFNHFVCVIVGSIVNACLPDKQGQFPVTSNIFHEPWFFWASIMGIIFISLFNLVAFTVQRIGVAVTSVANKLSLVIPFLFSIYLYHDSATVLKFLGVIVALIAVLLTCWPQKQSLNKQVNGLPARGSAKTGINLLLIILPVALFIGSGLLDTMIKYVEKKFINESNNNIYLIIAFATAATTGFVLLIFLFLTGKQKFDARSMIAGVCIGVPNYFSIWCLLKVLRNYEYNSSSIIPINNMGIVLFSSVMAWLLFKEKISAINWIGILLSLGAIALIAYG